MSTVNDPASKMDQPSCQSSWKRLRAAAVIEGTKFSQTEIKPVSLLGVYYSVWDSYTMLECLDDIGEEESWIKLSIKDPKKLENASFADIEGRFRWWRKVGSFKGLTRAEDSKENLWLVNGVTWSALVDVDDDDGANTYDDDDDGAEETRATNDFGLACLVTLDSAGKPFFEMLYNTGESKYPNSPDYVRVIWKKQKEGRRGLLMLSNGEGRRLVKDGAADLSETRNFDLDDENEGADNTDDEDEDAEGDLDEELELQSVNISKSQPDLKRPAEEDEEGQGAKRHKK